MIIKLRARNQQLRARHAMLAPAI